MVRLSELGQQARENHIPVMQEEGLELLLQYIQEKKVKRILEIGTAVGYSAIRFASVSSDIQVTTIEREDTLYQEAVHNVEEFHLENQITLLHGDALTISVAGTYDFIFIDAAKSQYIKFFEKYKENLAEDGVIVTDNLAFHGMVEHPEMTSNRNTRQLLQKIRNYIDFLKTNEEFDTVFYSVGDGISFSTRKKKK